MPCRRSACWLRAWVAGSSGDGATALNFARQARSSNPRESPRSYDRTAILQTIGGAYGLQNQFGPAHARLSRSAAPVQCRGARAQPGRRRARRLGLSLDECRQPAARTRGDRHQLGDHPRAHTRRQPRTSDCPAARASSRSSARFEEALADFREGARLAASRGNLASLAACPSARPTWPMQGRLEQARACSRKRRRPAARRG